MMHLVRRLASDRRAASAIEFALTAPVAILFLVGTAQLGILFAANSGLQHALAEGARYVTIYPTPSNSQIIAKVRAQRFGFDPNDVTELTVTRGQDAGTNYADLRISYAVRLNFIFFSTQGFTLTKTRRAFIP